MSKTEEAIQKFDVPNAAIAKMSEEYMPLTVSEHGVKKVHAARMIMRGLRVRVEKVRKEQKADFLAAGRVVDGEAKRIQALIEPIETHLAAEEDADKAKKQAIIDEENRLIAEAEQKKVDAENARIQAEKDAEAARIKAEQDAENERLRVAREKLEAEKAEAAAKQAEYQAKLDAERAEIEAEKKKLADAELKRKKAEEDAAAKLEAEAKAKREAEEKAKADAAEAVKKAEREKAAIALAEKLKPDREKLAAVADSVRAITVPAVSVDAADAAKRIEDVLVRAANRVQEISASFGWEPGL
jgi:hypothetical protein